MGSGAGFSLVELLGAMVVLGVGLGGLAGLLTASARGEGAARARMAARWEAVAALEGLPEGVRVQRKESGWETAGLLTRWRGHGAP
jgi:Tfp pilus assembly protein PilV